MYVFLMVQDMSVLLCCVLESCVIAYRYTTSIVSSKNFLLLELAAEHQAFLKWDMTC